MSSREKNLRRIFTPRLPPIQKKGGTGENMGEGEGGGGIKEEKINSIGKETNVKY